MRLLDLFCGRWGWSRAFAARGWECVGIDLVDPPEVPQGCTFIKADILGLDYRERFGFISANCGDPLGFFDFICASSPCEQFSVHGMKHFHPNPPYPEMGIKLFNHTRMLCEASGVPYVMENVRAAQQFVGNAVHHCGPFYLWGNGVPVLLSSGITKGMHSCYGKAAREFKARGDLEGLKTYRKLICPACAHGSNSKQRKDLTSSWATIPPELSNAVADYAERLCEVPA